MESIYSIASPSSSTLYGNIGSSLKELILSKFPYNYFKYVNISTELAFRNMRRTLGYNTKTEMHKRIKPYLVIKPIYSVGSPDQPLNDIPLTKNFDDILSGVDKRYLFNVLKDEENNYSLKYKMNRDKIDFDITITVSSLHEQLDLYKAMVNQFIWDRPYAYLTGLESMIPRSMIIYIAELMHIDINKNANKIPTLVNYLKRISNYPITYKMRNASATDEFFMYYNHKCIVTFTDLSIEEGSKKNMTDDAYNITFRASMEFNLPGLYVLSGNNDTIHNMQIDLVSINESQTSAEYIPLCTFTNFYNKYPTYRDGFKLYTTSIFNVDPNPSTGLDTLDSSVLFDNSVLSVLKSNILYGSDMNAFIKIYITKDNIELIENTDWSINYQKMMVTINHAEKTSTYRIIIYLNNLKMNNELITKFEDDKSNHRFSDAPSNILNK